MKRTTLFIVLGTIYLMVYSQRYSGKERLLFKLPQSEIEVKLKDRFGDNIHTDSSLCVVCRVHCSEWKRSKIDEIFTEYTYNPELLLDGYDTLHRKISPNERGRTLDSIFQHLYDWIKEIEDFAYNNKEGDRILMKYHNYYCCSSLDQHDYFLTVYPDYINISTSIYMRDSKGSYCLRWTKMRLRTVTEFKKRLLNYTSNHNINITL